MREVQGGHYRDTFSAKHLAATADFSHPFVQMQGRSDHIVLFPGVARDTVVLALDGVADRFVLIVLVLASSDL